jgi:ABC-type taurine transport system ATPase subunit
VSDRPRLNVLSSCPSVAGAIASFVGGETAFLDYDRVVTPVAGRGLCFFHRVLHEGREVKDGVKYALRAC